jgi:hypothetical protein
MITLSIEGPEDLVRSLELELKSNGLEKFVREDENRALEGAGILHLSIQLVDLTLHAVSIWLSVHHLARAVIKIRRGRKLLNLSKATKVEEIRSKIEKE